MEENKIQVSVNKDKKTTIWVVAIIVFVVICFGIYLGVLVSEDGVGKNDELTLIRSNMSVEYSSYSDEYTATITGVIKNTSGKKLSYASVTFAIYNAAGDSLGTAYDNISGIVKDGTWSFDAKLFFATEQPVNYKLIEITTW